jgi:hypothetical protein
MLYQLSYNDVQSVRAQVGDVHILELKFLRYQLWVVYVYDHHDCYVLYAGRQVPKVTGSIPSMVKPGA